MNILQPKLVLIAAAVAVVLLLVSLAQEMNRRWQIQREVHRLEQDVTAMRKTIIELENVNQYFRTDDFRERLAREKLNYQAPGEKVVLVPDQGTNVAVAPPPTPVTATHSIPERWWRRLFVDTQT